MIKQRLPKDCIFLLQISSFFLIDVSGRLTGHAISYSQAGLYAEELKAFVCLKNEVDGRRNEIVLGS